MPSEADATPRGLAVVAAERGLRAGEAVDTPRALAIDGLAILDELDAGSAAGRPGMHDVREIFLGTSLHTT